MTSLALYSSGSLLAAASTTAADDRVREGILIPWDEPGRTNLGNGLKVRRSFAAGLQAGAKVVGVYGHNRPDQDAPAVSRLLEFQDRPEGLWGRIKIARTPLGDQLLAEIDDGARDGLSIEAGSLVYDAEGHVIGGTLDFYAHVPVGAYDSARATALVAAVTPGDAVPDAPPATPAAPAAPAALDPATLQAVVTATMSALQASAHVAGSDGPSALSLLGAPNVPGAPGGAPVDPVQQAATLQAQVANGGGAQLMAALQDITHTGLPMFQRPAGTIGEKLWEGGQTVRRWWSLMDTSTPLTSMKGTSWQWTRGPEMAAWAGDKTEVPTNPVTLEEVPWTARRCAGGWDIDRAYRDFGTPEFWAEFYAEQVESYLELTDQWAAEALISYARDITAEGMVPPSYGVLTAVEAGPTQILRAAALGTAILEDTPKVKQGPDWIAVNTLDWLTLADVTGLDIPAFMALLKIAPSNFMRTADVPRGEVIMGVTKAAKARELGNGAPIRVEALDVARGGIDSAVYGYVAYEHRRPGGIISVPLAPAA